MHSREKTGILQDLNPAESQRLLKEGAKTLGINLSSRQVEQFMDYLALLDQWNRHVNLTGLRSCEEIIVKHFLDSLIPLPYIPEKATLLDLGTGAGFPGLPIKIVRPSQPVTLIEASSKKVSFLKEVIRNLKLGFVPIYQTYLGKRAAPLMDPHSFDVVITRGVGKILDLLAAADSVLKPGGKFLFMKGPKGPEEMFGLKIQIQERGFQIDAPIVVTLPLLEQQRILILISKTEEGKL